MALVSLSLGLVLLPVGFISFHGALAVLVQVAPASVLFLCIGIEILRRHEPEPAAKPKPAIPIPIMPEPAMPVMPTPAMPMPAAREQPSRLLIETLTELHSSLMALASAQAESSLKYWELALESTRARLVALEDQLTRLSDDYLPGAANTRQVFQFKAICAEIQKSSREIMEIMESLSRPERTIEFTRRRLQDLKPIVLQLDELLDELLVTLKELADSG